MGIGQGKGLMYMLPKIQGTLANCTQPDALQELEARQDSILKQLDTLKNRVESLKGKANTNKDDNDSMLDIVVHCSYHKPAYSLQVACRWLQDQMGLKIFTCCHVHSSVKKSLGHLLEFLPQSNCSSRIDADLRITIVWKEDGQRDPECFVSTLPNCHVKGEVNLMRFLNRQYGLLRDLDIKNKFVWESKSDEWLDRLHSSIIWVENSSDEKDNKLKIVLRDIEKTVATQSFLMQEKKPGVVDLVAYTSIKEAIDNKNQSKAIQKYIRDCKTHFEPSCQVIQPTVGNVY